MSISKQTLEHDLLERTQALIKASQRTRQNAYDEHTRRSKRQVSTTEDFDFTQPQLWGSSNLHNPYFVRSRRRQLAHRVVREIKNRTYEPNPPFKFSIAKENGKDRQISAFNIVDEAVSHALLRSLTSKNLQKLSTHSYAYLPDRGPYDAIARLQTEWSDQDRLYIAEFDFRDFFGSLDHQELIGKIQKENLLVSKEEQFLIEVFLKVMAPIHQKGLSQGTSLSVLLANLAAIDLDRGFEQIGVGYVRYADDTIFWSRDYNRISEAADFIYRAAREIGTAVNDSKSPGIRMLVRSDNQATEIPSTTQVDFLGHSIGIERTALSQVSMDRIQSDINGIIYQTLLREPLRGNQNLDRLGSLDRDYVTCIWQLRSYIYGNLTENELRRFGSSTNPSQKRYRGAAALYPLVNDLEQLESIDHWLSARLRSALRKRQSLLPSYASSLEPYLSLNSPSLNELSNLKQRSSTTNQIIDLRIPSFRLINRVLHSAINEHGFAVTSKTAGNFLYSL